MILIALLLLIAAFPLHAQAPYTEENLLAFYRYDKSQPLEASFDTLRETSQLYEIKVTFNSIRQERVPAMLYIPRTATPSSPLPCVFWLHGYGGSKEETRGMMILIQQLGYAFICLDAQYHGERRRPTKDMYSLDLVQDRYALAQTVIDHRRALDLLETMPEIDPDRIGLVGGSMGAIIGALLAGVDSRIKVSILVSGGGGWVEMIRISDLGPATLMRGYLRGYYQIVDRLLDPVDPINLIHRVHTLQMHHGTEDVTVPYSTGVALFEKAGEPKEFYSYPGEDHYSIIRGESLYLIIVRAVNWLNQHLRGK